MAKARSRDDPAALLDLPHPGRTQPRPIVEQNIVNEIRIEKNIRSAGTRNQRNVRVGQHAAQLAQGRHSQHRVAHPVRAADDDAFDLVRMWLVSFQGNQLGNLSPQRSALFVQAALPKQPQARSAYSFRL